MPGGPSAGATTEPPELTERDTAPGVSFVHTPEFTGRGDEYFRIWIVYSRDFEREADEFAIGFLHANGLPVLPLYEFFLKLRALESRLGMEGLPDFLSTHPATDDRMQRLWRELH